MKTDESFDLVDKYCFFFAFLILIFGMLFMMILTFISGQTTVVFVERAYNITTGEILYEKHYVYDAFLWYIELMSFALSIGSIMQLISLLYDYTKKQAKISEILIFAILTIVFLGILFYADIHKLIRVEYIR